MPLKDYDECMRALMGFINHTGVVISWLATRPSSELQMNTLKNAPESIIDLTILTTYNILGTFELGHPENSNCGGEEEDITLSNRASLSDSAITPQGANQGPFQLANIAASLACMLTE